jgi:hypothetical protein
MNMSGSLLDFIESKERIKDNEKRDSLLNEEQMERLKRFSQPRFNKTGDEESPKKSR